MHERTTRPPPSRSVRGCKLRRTSARSLLALAGLVTSCGPSRSLGFSDASGPRIDPRGNDATFNVSWLINGQDPTLPSDPCHIAGVRYVRLTFVAPNGAPVVNDPFEFDCNAGSYRSAHPELRAGTWEVVWDALASNGARVSVAAGTFENGVLQPTLETVIVRAGDDIDFDSVNRPDATFPPAPTNFSTGTADMQVNFAFAEASGATTGAPCGSAGAATIDWILRRSNGVIADRSSHPFACASGYGSLRWNALDFDRYSLEVHGYDTGGLQAWHGTCSELFAPLSSTAPTTFSCLVDRSAGP